MALERISFCSHRTQRNAFAKVSIVTASIQTGVNWPPSLWAATAPAAPALPELEGDQTSDVVIVGAGFTGLSTAIHLREMGIAADRDRSRPSLDGAPPGATTDR
jgi:threonine dehydrogenase-like Zn-dependent dehydrogenase